MCSGFILIDKPVGITSFKALGAVKKQFGIKRVGHAGTLDMAASGLIVAALGKCTRLLSYIEAQDKVYTFNLHLGILTDTLEPTGNILKQDNNAARTAEEINAALQTFIGEIEQIPPAFSAIKINGTRASDLALKGLDIELKPRNIRIFQLSILNYQPSAVHQRDAKQEGSSQLSTNIYCKCSKGTYIRSLARDIAEKLGTYGVASCIRRLAIGDISVERASDKIIPPQELLNWPVIEINSEEARKILNGLPIPNPQSPIPNPQSPINTPIFVSNNEKIIAVAGVQNEYIAPRFLLD
ncbi:MAG: tRNA pseudouridine(55) synthase TruB [Fibromonadaceae bacterium]|jgi:tRNA pseudouridine55 synthase|nr:tRNA pseudouridine(55) synthase TruB [Fibromonadaceae bacterium]